MCAKKRSPKLPSFRDVEQHIESDDFAGWCTVCGDWTHDSCEPDAAEYECPECECCSCYGAEQLLIEGLVDMSDDANEEYEE